MKKPAKYIITYLNYSIMTVFFLIIRYNDLVVGTWHIFLPMTLLSTRREAKYYSRHIHVSSGVVITIICDLVHGKKRSLTVP